MKQPSIHIIDLNSPKKWTSFLIKSLAQSIFEKRMLLIKDTPTKENTDEQHE